MAGTTYQDIADTISAAIRQGDIAVGDSLPSIIALARRHGVAHTTAQRALRHLRDTGIVETRPGLPAIVVAVPSDRPRLTVQQQIDSLEARVARLEQERQSGG